MESGFSSANVPLRSSLRPLFMRATLTIQRLNPEAGNGSYAQSYDIEVGREATLLSALLKIKGEMDGTLTFRASCRAAICGSCLMQVNGTQKLACRVSLHEEMARHGQLMIGPMAHMPVIKDLVVRMDPFWEKIRAVAPYVIPKGDSPPAEAFKSLREDLHNADGCILCGACLSACPVFAVSPAFLGPAALAKVYRFQVDPRDTHPLQRLESLQDENGIWDCVRCNYCVEVCPKEVAPMEQIIRLRRRSLEAGFSDSIGARHITQFVKVVGEEGRLNETKLPILMNFGNWRLLTTMLGVGIKMLLRGKVPFPFKRSPAYHDVRRIFGKR